MCSDFSWLIALWLIVNFWGLALFGQWVIVNFTECRDWTGANSGIVAGGCWGRQTLTYQFIWILHYVQGFWFFVTYVFELCYMK